MTGLEDFKASHSTLTNGVAAYVWLPREVSFQSTPFHQDQLQQSLFHGREAARV